MHFDGLTRESIIADQTSHSAARRPCIAEINDAEIAAEVL